LSSVPEYRRYSWVDPRLEIGPSPIQGRGLIARAPIGAGEIVTVWGGVLMTAKEIHAGRGKPHSIAEIGEDLCLASEQSDPDSPADFMNHSCDPNVWMLDEVTLTARRHIEAGDEMTIDYALWGGIPPWHKCTCGSSACRGRVTSDDWRIPELQVRYAGHWSPYITARMRG
jgi:hypothetical protein